MEQEQIKKTKGSVKDFLLPILFFLFISLVAIVDLFSLDISASPLNNRPLPQKPQATVETLLSGQWSGKYQEYASSQLVSNGSLLQAHSFLSRAAGRLERNGVWIAKDGYLIEKNDTLSSLQQNKLPANIAAIVEMSRRFSGNLSVMIVPSPANILSDKLLFSPPQIDENAMLDKMFAEFAASGTNVVDVREAFIREQAETGNVFYRTDHHWTTTGGAFVAYKEFCKATGIEVFSPQSELVDVPEFFGANYTKTLQFNAQADILQYYDLPNTLTTFLPKSGGGFENSETPIMDYSKLSVYDKYAAFIYGNNGYSEIKGDGEGKILVIKDSFGNSFVPYLVANFETVGIIDLRNWASVDSLIEEKGYEDVLILYSFSALSGDMFLYRIADNMQ